MSKSIIIKFLKDVVASLALLPFLVVVSCGFSEPEFDLSKVFYGLDVDGENITDLIPTVHIPNPIWEQLRYYERESERRHYADVSPFYGETLTILIEWHLFDQDRMRMMVDNFMRMHPGVNIKFTFQDEIQGLFNSRFNDYEDTLCLLRAGTAPILMQTISTFIRGDNWRIRLLMNTEMRDFFADWLPVMDNHPGFCTDEWNMHVLNASRIHGELFEFPAFQNIRFITANRSIPVLSQMFGNKDTITVSELVDLYALHSGYVNGYYFINSFILWYIIDYVLPNFFDACDGNVMFDTEEFIDLLLELFYNVNFFDDLHIDIDHNVTIRDFVWDEILRENCFFRILSDGFGRFESFSFTGYDAYFINPLPVVTNDGRLKVFDDILKVG